MADGRAFLEVSDTGVGIPAAERAQVFERFYRASNSRTPGSGLGLAIVQEVAQDAWRRADDIRGRGWAWHGGADHFFARGPSRHP